MITCDIKSGFHHVPLHSDYQNYITFVGMEYIINGKLFHLDYALVLIIFVK